MANGGAQHRLAHFLDDGVLPMLDDRGDDGIEGHGRTRGRAGTIPITHDTPLVKSSAKKFATTGSAD